MDKVVFFILGKSGTGKTTIMNSITSNRDLNLKRIMITTNRPRRTNEGNQEYDFVKVYDTKSMFDDRSYKVSYCKEWKYGTNSNQLETDDEFYIVQGPKEMYDNYKEYAMKNSNIRLIPIMITCDEYNRISRLIERENNQVNKNWRELYRRLHEDEALFDGVEDITNRDNGITISNDDDINQTINDIIAYILKVQRDYYKAQTIR